MRLSSIAAITVFALAAAAGCKRPAGPQTQKAAPRKPPATCFKIVVVEPGTVRVTCDDLAKTADVSALDPRRLNLYCGGRPVPVFIEGESDGRIDPGDGIIFRCAQSNPRSPVDVFWLRPAAEGEQPLRSEKHPIQPVENTKNTTRTLSLRPGGYMNASARNIWPGEAATLTATTPAAGLRLDADAKAELMLRLRRTQAGVDMRVQWQAKITVGNTVLPLKQKVNGLNWEITCEMPQSLFTEHTGGASLVITIHNDSDIGRNRPENFIAASLSIIGASLRVTGEFTGPSRDAYITPRIEPYELESPHGEFPHHPDLKSTANEADYLIIAPGAFIGAAQSLARHRALPRRDGERFAVMTVDAQEIYDQFDHGRFGPKAIRDFLAYARKNWKRPPRYVLLAADARHDIDPDGAGRVIPAYQYDTYFCGRVGTDNYAASEDGIPEIAIGRLPADSPEELALMAEKTIACETASEHGPWRRRLEVFAGTADYGQEIEALLQSMFKMIFGSLMPRAFDLRITYAGKDSEYYFPAEKFRARFIDSINEGALVTAYVGHGEVRALDNVYINNRAYPIFEASDVSRLSCRGRSPVMVIIACDSGAFDLPGEECLAEEILKAKDAPVAVIASSWVSHMYPNGVFGIELMPAFFGNPSDSGALADAKPARRLMGDVLARLKARAIKSGGLLRGMLDLAARGWVSSKAARAALKADNLYLFNLIGDPALQITLPEHDIDLRISAESATAGDTVTVSGACPGTAEGTALVTLECDITDPLYPPYKVQNDTPAEYEERHRQANDKVVLTAEVEVKNGKFTLNIAIPATLKKTSGALKPGAYYIKAYIKGRDSDAFAAKPIEIIP